MGCGARASPRAGSSRQAPRLTVGQLAGAVGTLSAWGPDGPELQRRVMARLDSACRITRASLRATVWPSSRRCWRCSPAPSRRSGTRSTTSSERRSPRSPRPPSPGVVGSITMPQKRNPERSEHLGTLARHRALVGRAGAGGPGRRARAGRRGLEDRVGLLPAGVHGDGDGPGARKRALSPGCASTRSGCARTSRHSRATCSPSG